MYFTGLLSISLGRILHSSVPLPGSGCPFGPRCHSTWRFRRHYILPETRLVQTRGGTGIHMFVKKFYILEVAQAHLICGRYGVMLAPRFSSPTLSDWVP